MKRLPAKPTNVNTITTCTAISKEMNKKLIAEQKRVGAKNRSEMLRMILEAYFKLEEN